MKKELYMEIQSKMTKIDKLRFFAMGMGSGWVIFGILKIIGIIQ